MEKSRRWNTPDGSPLLTKLLEEKNEFGMTALAIACHLKDPTLIELLVDAGADCKVLDQDGNTAIFLVASSPTENKAPTKELCPSIFKVFILISLSFFLSSMMYVIFLYRFTKVWIKI